MWPLKSLFRVFAICLFLAAPTGCTAFMKALPTAATAVSDAGAVLSIIEQAVDAWFTTVQPDPELRHQANSLIADAWTGLRIANASVEGSRNLSEDEKAAAFKEFQRAYEDLHAFLKKHGILKRSGLGGPGGGEIQISEPMAMAYGR